MPNSLERKFLHDLASPLSVAKLLLKKVISEVDNLGGDPVASAKVKDRLGKIETSLDKMARLHGDFKIAVSELENAKKAA